jgi:hypothetical protein
MQERGANDPQARPALPQVRDSTHLHASIICLVSQERTLFSSSVHRY